TYETILNTMLETRINDFGMEDVHSEITKQVPVVHNTLPTNIVILKPGDSPNCNENIHTACEMYRDDLSRGDRLYISTVMLKIKAAQSERDHLSMLLVEYIDDIVASQNAHVIKSCKDSLWSLVAKLSSAFGEPNPATHYLFRNAPEISENGIKNILSFY
ncbi:470_t:CDS:2, partial [Ambispora gerdemannii]